MSGTVHWPAADRRSRPTPDPVLSCILSRRSVAPKRLVAPGPSAAQVRTLVAAAITVPDHGALRPWRFVRVAEDARARLADVFVAARRRRRPETSPEILAREREKAMNAPTLIAVIGRLRRAETEVPASEQYASIGAAIQTLLLAAHALGFAGIVLSGERVRDPLVCAAFGLAVNEELVGFVSLGTLGTRQPEKPRPAVDDHLSIWTGPPPDVDA